MMVGIHCQELGAMRLVAVCACTCVCMSLILFHTKISASYCSLAVQGGYGLDQDYLTYHSHNNKTMT